MTSYELFLFVDAAPRSFGSGRVCGLIRDADPRDHRRGRQRLAVRIAAAIFLAAAKIRGRQTAQATA
jgi:hypothetical protein